MGRGIPPLNNDENPLESKPLRSRFLVRGLTTCSSMAAGVRAQRADAGEPVRCARDAWEVSAIAEAAEEMNFRSHVRSGGALRARFARSRVFSFNTPYA